jgi:hypothetical protein
MSTKIPDYLTLILTYSREKKFRSEKRFCTVPVHIEHKNKYTTIVTRHVLGFNLKKKG